MIQEYREKFSGLRVTTNEECGVVTKAIGVLRTTRTGIDKRRKELTENAREYVSSVNSVAKELTSQIEEIEEPLKKRKQVFEDEKQRLKQEAEEARQAKINNRMVEFLQQTGQTCSLKEAETWTDDEYVTALSNTRAAYQQQIEEARKQEEERQRLEAESAEQIRQQQEEIEKQRAEIERIRAEQQAEIDRIKAEQEQSRLAHEAELNRIRDEQAERDRVEREKLEAERQAVEAERQRLQAIEDERQAKIFAEQEAKRIKEEAEAAEALAEHQRIEREKALAELMPNIEKAKAYCNTLATLVEGARIPLFDHQGRKVEAQIIHLQDTLLKTIVERCIAIENMDENLTDGV
jgi:DNA repair exonuclease SbcCD ATPase subunit